MGPRQADDDVVFACLSPSQSNLVFAAVLGY